MVLFIPIPLSSSKDKKKCSNVDCKSRIDILGNIEDSSQGVSIFSFPAPCTHLTKVYIPLFSQKAINIIISSQILPPPASKLRLISPTCPVVSHLLPDSCACYFAPYFFLVYNPTQFPSVSSKCCINAAFPSASTSVAFLPPALVIF